MSNRITAHRKQANEIFEAPQLRWAPPPGAEKVAFIFGASPPAAPYLAASAIPYERRRDAVLTYGKNKAREEATPLWKSVGAGGVLGGAAGGLLGAAAPGRGGPLVLGALGAGLGALTGTGLHLIDADEVAQWRRAQENPAIAEAMANSRIDGAVLSQIAENDARQRRIEGALVQAALRPTEVRHIHYGGGGGGSTGSPASPPPPPSRFACGHCGMESDSSLGNCTACGAPMSRGTKLASFPRIPRSHRLTWS